MKWIPAMKSFGIGYYVTITFNYLLKKGEKKKKITSDPDTHTPNKRREAHSNTNKPLAKRPTITRNSPKVERISP